MCGIMLIFVEKQVFMRKLTVLALGLAFSVSCLAGSIVHGPWVSEVRDCSLTVLWTSEKPGMAYVELEDSTRIWETFAGRRIFKRHHSIHLSGLEAGSVLRYRVCGIDLADDTNARDPRFGAGYQGEWHSVRTFDPKARSCRFSVFNDIHMRRPKYSALAAQVDSAATDFLFLNGDIVSAGNYVSDTLERYEIDPLGNLPAGIPLLFARGNHEGRGNRPDLVAELFPNREPSPFYYTFRHGPVAFIVFDAGETSRKRSIRYSGNVVYEEYLNEQIAWAKKAMRERSFRTAPVKVCLIHVPMIDHPDQNDFHTQRWLNKHMVPMLNKGGIDLMIGADLHEFMYCEPGSMGNSFPIVVNDEAKRLEFVYENRTITIKTFTPKGEPDFEKTLRQ